MTETPSTTGPQRGDAVTFTIAGRTATGTVVKAYRSWDGKRRVDVHAPAERKAPFIRLAASVRTSR